MEWIMREPSSVDAGGGNADRAVDAAAGFVRRPGVEHQRRADLHVVAAGELLLLHPLAVDEGAVGAVQVGDCVVAVRAAELGVLAGDFGIVNVQRTRLVAPQPNDRLVKLEACALIVSANDK